MTYNFLKQKIQERIDRSNTFQGTPCDQFSQEGFFTDGENNFKTMQNTQRNKKKIYSKSRSVNKIEGRKKSAYSTITHDIALSNIYADLMEN